MPKYLTITPYTRTNGFLYRLCTHAAVKAIASQYYYSMALKEDGTVWAAGWNGSGELGDGTNQQKKS